MEYGEHGTTYVPIKILYAKSHHGELALLPIDNSIKSKSSTFILFWMKILNNIKWALLPTEDSISNIKKLRLLSNSISSLTSSILICDMLNICQINFSEARIVNL